MLGKRPITVDLIEDTQVEEAVGREVKRRRKNQHPAARPPTTHEKRNIGRTTITKLLKENQNLIVPWDEIMDNYLEGKESRSLNGMKSVGDFIDGAELLVHRSLTGPQLQR